MPRSAETDAATVPGRGLGALLLLLLTCSALPLLTHVLPAGPAALTTPRAVAATSAIVLLFFVFGVWPATGPRGSAGPVTVHGALLLLTGATFVLVQSLAAGAGLTAPLTVAGVLAASTLLTGTHLAAGGGSGKSARGFAQLVLLLCFGLPIGNYALNEFGGVSGGLGYQLSPPLLVRRILLGHPDANPLPFLLLCMILLAIGYARRRLRPEEKPTWLKTVLVLLILTGTARGDGPRVAPLLGDAYRPGRALPVLVLGGDPESPPGVQIAGLARIHGDYEAGGSLLLLPAPRNLNLIHVMTKDGWEERDLVLRPVSPNACLLVSFSGVTDKFLEVAAERNVVISRAHPSAAGLEPDRLALVLLAADAVFDPERVLPEDTARKIEAAGVSVLTEATVAAIEAALRDRSILRRVWEESDTLLAPDGLFELFPATGTPLPERSRTALLILTGFSLLLFAGVRFILRRRINPAASVFIAALACGWTVFLGVFTLPAPPDWESRSITLREGGRSVVIELLSARRASTAISEGAMVLGRGAIPVIRPEGLLVALNAFESRIAVGEAFGEPPLPGEPDVLIGPDGLRIPGEAALPPTEFLKAHFPSRPGRPDPRALMLRKLVRLAKPPEKEVGIRFPGPGRPFLDVIPLAR